MNSAFLLASNESKELFQFGKDLICLKQGFRSRCNQSASSIYNYNNKEKALLGFTSSFRIEQFFIYQMK